MAGPQIIDPERSGKGFEALRTIILERYKPPESGSRRRVVAVIGAGASLPSGLPSWDELRELLLATVREALLKQPEYIEEFWRSQASVIGPWDPAHQCRDDSTLDRLLAMVTPEALLSTACKYESLGGLVRDRICDKLSRASAGEIQDEPRPQLFYEILAHLLKHGFIDDVVSFNFDGLLEAALDNELGKDNYVLQVSDRRSVSGSRGARPRLLKVHGSVTERWSLRFTPENIGALSVEHERMLKEVVLDGCSTDTDAKGARVDIISFGYSWRDRGFSNWLLRQRQHIGSITVVDRDGDVCERLERLWKPNGAMKINGVSTASLFGEHSELFTLDHLAWALWNSLAEQMKSKHFFTPASRHVLLAFWFGGTCLLDRNGSIKELRMTHDANTRFTAEILLHLAKCKGMVNASVMARLPRINKYYQKLEPRYRGYGMVSELLKGYLKESPVAEVRETFFAEKHSTPEFAEQVFMFWNKFDPSDTLRIPKWDPDQRRILGEPVPVAQFIGEQINEIVAAPEVEVVAGSDLRSDWLFGDAKPVTTYLEFQEASKRLLGDTRWTHLLLVAESGEWLSKEPIKSLIRLKGKERRVLLIAASKRALQDWHVLTPHDPSTGTVRPKTPRELVTDSVVDGNTKLLIGEIPWWEHNRHMTIGYDENMRRIVGGVYFRRRLKTASISPVRLDVESSPNWSDPLGADETELLMMFLSYAGRAVEESIRAVRALAGETSEARFRDTMQEAGRCLEFVAEVQRLVSTLAKDEPPRIPGHADRRAAAIRSRLIERHQQLADLIAIARRREKHDQFREPKMNHARHATTAKTKVPPAATRSARRKKRK